MKYINFKENNKLLNLYYLILLLVSVFFMGSILFDIFEIHIYRHDELYYLAEDSYYLYKFPHEGRWIISILSPILSLISGKILSFLILLFLFVFLLVSSYKWTKNFYYAIIVTLLFLQIPSLYAQLMWPATSMPAFFVLALSAFVVRFLPIYIFYMLFGILFFGTLSNFYYLLPLLHLSLLTSDNIKVNLKVLFLKIIPAWALGFIVGYGITQVILYITIGQWMTIEWWREPQYIHSMSDFIENVLRSFNYLQRDIELFFLNTEIIILYFIAVSLTFLGVKKHLFFISLILYFAMIIIHYVIVTPVGLYISPRSVFATWVGILAIAFYIPSIKKWQIFFITPIIIFFTFSLYERNHANLQWYSTVTNTHYSKLLKESPQPPQTYKAVILCASDSDIQKRNVMIEKQFNLSKINHFENLDNFMRWVPIAHETGFKTVISCNGSKSRLDFNTNSINLNDVKSICKEISEIYDVSKTDPQNNNNFYTIIGEYNGMLIISLNSNFKF